MWLIVVVCSALAVLPASTAIPYFRNDYTFDSASQAFYKEHPPRTWSEAVTQCTAEGTQLAAPRTEAQVRALTRYMGASTPGVWVGISDLLARGFYMTLDGYSASEIFMKWKNLEPTNDLGNDNCIQMDRAGLYNVTVCNITRQFICKKELSTGERWARTLFRPDYVYESAFSAFYKGHVEMSSWQEAVFTCAAEGASLAVPASSDERQLLLDLMWGAGLWAWDIWLGIHDIDSEGKYTYLNGTSVPNALLTWAGGQPDNFKDNEDCIEMHFNGAYNDYGCTGRRRFVCKKEQRAVSGKNSLCETYDTEYLYSLSADRCYKLHTGPESWHDALKTCLAEGAQLGIINSEAEAQIYISIIRRKSPLILEAYNSTIVHVGFTDLLSPGEFKSLSGETLEDTGYNKWSPNQPDNNLGKEHCGSMMLADARLNDVDCDTKALFLCEKSIGRPLST